MSLSILFLGVAFVIIGSGMFFQARKARKWDQARQSWPTAKGTIASIEVFQPAVLAAGNPKGPEQFDVSVKYEFRAGGQLHFGSTISYPHYLHEKEEADRIASRYPAGEAATVYYNPEDYRECYLEIPNTAKNYRTSIVLLVIGGIIGLVGILQLFG